MSVVRDNGGSLRTSMVHGRRVGVRIDSGSGV